MITETENELMYTFFTMGLEKEDNFCFMCILRKANACDEMLQWLKKNPEFGYSEIFDKVLEIAYREKL